MAMANKNLIGVFVTKLWSVQELACDGGGGDGGGTTKNIIPPKFLNFGDIIINNHPLKCVQWPVLLGGASVVSLTGQHTFCWQNYDNKNNQAVICKYKCL